jgi:hypothetical protein
MADRKGEHRVRAQWVNVEDTELTYANQFAVQNTPTELVILVGQVAHPFFVGTDEEQAAQVQALTSVDIRTVARLAVPRPIAGELLKFLESQIAKYDARMVGDNGDGE